MDFKQVPWGQVVVVGLLEAIIGIGGTAAFNQLRDSTVREIGIVALWITVILVGGGFLIARMVTRDFLRRGETLTTGPPIPIEENNPTTGETVPFIMLNYDGIGHLLTYCLTGLKLGEIALLRRLNVAPDMSQLQRRCETVLAASGIGKPGISITRLEAMEMIKVDDSSGQVTLAPKGEQAVWQFTQCLTHDPKLVAAYRLVTPLINRSIRFDGGAPIT